MLPSLQRARGPAVAALTAILLLAPFGCKSGGRRNDTNGALLSTSLPMASNVRAVSHGSVAKGSRFFFPELQIYDPSGSLIYSSHQSMDNARVLRELPGGIESLRPKPGAAQLAEVLETMPDFRARKKEILQQHRVSVVSIFLEDCHACSLQEDAFGDAKHRLLDHGINLLVVRVSRK